MALYVIPVPQPAPGTDWTYTVPGQYIEHIVGITANLHTQNGTLEQPMYDSSPHGENGTYGFGGNIAPLSLVPGLVFGDPAVRAAGVLGEVNPIAVDLFAADFTVGFWVQGTGNNGFYQAMVAFAGSTHTVDIDGRNNHPNLALEMRRFYDAVNTDTFFFGSTIDISTPRFVLWTYDAATGTGTVYVGGVLAGTDTVGAHPMVPVTTRLFFTGGTPTFVRTFDEIIIFTSVLSQADASNLDAAAGVDYTTWRNTVDALGPAAWYALDDSGTTTSDTVDLIVTDGTHTTAEIPAGGGGPFPGPGPYAYSWQPNLNSSSQTPDGKVTTVAIPDLILPAGYTVGTRTLNLSTLDQWSDIFIWWDSGYMDALDPLNAYVFPGGIRLVYQQERP